MQAIPVERQVAINDVRQQLLDLTKKLDDLLKLHAPAK